MTYAYYVISIIARSSKNVLGLSGSEAIIRLRNSYIAALLILQGYDFDTMFLNYYSTTRLFYRSLIKQDQADLARIK